MTDHPVRCQHPIEAVRWTRNRVLCTTCGRALELDPEPCTCPCHAAVADGLVPCPACERS